MPRYDAPLDAPRRRPLGEEGPCLEHRLVQGETLDLLAWRYYGDARLWWRIADANPRREPDAWPPGALLRVPHPRGGRR